MGEVHKLIEQHGAEVMRRMDFPRAVVDAAAGYMSAEERDLFPFHRLGASRPAPP